MMAALTVTSRLRSRPEASQPGIATAMTSEVIDQRTDQRRTFSWQPIREKEDTMNDIVTRYLSLIHI